MSDDPVAFAEGIEFERERIRAAFKARCGLRLLALAGSHESTISLAKQRCGMNKGHISGCSPIAATVSITRERLEEILNG